MFVYKNTSEGSTLEETLGLNLEGLKVEGQEDQSKVEIILGPGQQKVIKLVKTGGGYSFGSSASYSIST